MSVGQGRVCVLIQNKVRCIETNVLCANNLVVYALKVCDVVILIVDA